MIEEKDVEKKEKLSLTYAHLDGHQWVEECFVDSPEEFGKMLLDKLRDKRVTVVLVQTQGLRPVKDDLRGR